MGKKKTPLRKSINENVDASDLITQNESKPRVPLEDTSSLRQQIDQMREHSTRLIAEYNKKLEALRHENVQLTEELQHSRTMV
ncbi:hypothetical protein COOONC_26589, partial [Cooperia oncophora]